MAKANPEDVAGDVQRLLESWNPPPEDHSLEVLVGSNPDPEDTRTTVAGDGANSDDDDAQKVFEDDLDSEDEDYSGEEWTKDALKEEAESRGLSQAGNKDDLRARLIESDNEDD